MNVDKSVDPGARPKPVACHDSVMPTRRPIDASQLRALASAMPVSIESAANLVRSMRDNGRY